MFRKKLSRPYTLELVFLLLTALWIIRVPHAANGTMAPLSVGFGSETRIEHPEYSLKLEFALKTGSYLANIDVNIFQEGHPVQNIHSPGPWLFVDLAPGSYSVVATLEDGRSQGAKFSITADKQLRVILSWTGE